MFFTSSLTKSVKNSTNSPIIFRLGGAWLVISEHMFVQDHTLSDSNLISVWIKRILFVPCLLRQVEKYGTGPWLPRNRQ